MHSYPGTGNCCFKENQLVKVQIGKQIVDWEPINNLLKLENMKLYNTLSYPKIFTPTTYQNKYCYLCIDPTWSI